MTQTKFKIGDRVRANDDRPAGRYGTVVVLHAAGMIGVSFENFDSGHSCGGLAPTGTGWNMEPRDIEPVPVILNTGDALANGESLNALAAAIHELNRKWWVSLETGEPIQRNKGEMLCLIHSEISEAMEGERKDLQDDKLPHRKMAEVELADAVIRILDYAAGHGYDIGGAIFEKLEYNKTRADHQPEQRRLANGKKF